MRTVVIPMEELAQLLQLQMETSGQSVLTVTGSSMLPMLHHRKDSVVLELIKEAPRKGDLILYRRESGAYILHRILRTDGDGYLCCGDNQWQIEPVGAHQLVALVTGFTRNGRHYENSHKGYRLYVWLWVGLHPVRRYILAVRRRLGRVRRAVAGRHMKK